jgi:hypothetical protein
MGPTKYRIAIRNLTSGETSYWSVYYWTRSALYEALDYWNRTYAGAYQYWEAE